MAKKDYVLVIVTDEEKLSNRADEINVAENQAQVRSIVSKLKDTMLANKDLVALAAPQLGYPYRIFCIRFADENIQTFINPMPVKIEGKSLSIEQTKSRPGKEYMVQRPTRLMAGYQLPSGQYNELSLSHPLSSLFEQMLDLLDGKLFFKYDVLGLPIDQEYYKASEEEKAELHTWYLDTFIPERLKALSDLAAKDDDIKALQNQIKYYRSIIEGETEVVPINKDGELDFEHSSVKTKEAEDKFRKDYLEGLKKNLGVE